MDNNIYLSVIIPAYNEAERIGATLRKIAEYLQKQSYSSEIIVVIDGAKDNTAEILAKMAADISNLYVINRKENYGKGYSVKEGMLMARGKIRLFADADNSTDISHFNLMRPIFNRGYDIVIASRSKMDAQGACHSVPQNWLKRFIGKLGNLFIQIFAVRGIWDTQCGFKAFQNYAAEKIFSQIKTNRWAFDAEVLLIASQLGYKMGIVPVDWKNDPRSQVTFPAYLNALWDTVKIRWYLISGKYRE